MLGAVLGCGLVLLTVLSYLATGWSRQLAVRLKILDDPGASPSRKKHTQPIPLMGATGFVLLACAAMASIWLIHKFDFMGLQNILDTGLYHTFSLGWILVSVGLLVIAGYLDDVGLISVKYRFLLVGLALLVTIFLGGLKIEALSYPFDGLLPDNQWLPGLLSFVWLGFCLFSTKVLDGHDGIVSSVGVVGFLQIAAISMFAEVNQPMIFVFALVWVAAILGFLPFNFPGAKLYLGDGGSMIIGFMLGVLSIISGAKIATAGTVIGWFILDVIFVWFRRILDKRNPLTSADRFHWHQRLTDSGLDKVQVLALTVWILLITAQGGLLFPTERKILVFLAQLVFLLLIFLATYVLSKKRKSNKNLS